jgi:hypothetical protein
MQSLLNAICRLRGSHSHMFPAFDIRHLIRHVQPVEPGFAAIRACCVRATAPSVRTFLIESERRVIEHCMRLLALRDLSLEDHQRLSRLVRLVDAQWQGFGTGRRLP